MSLHKSRNIICFILSIFVAIGSVLSIAIGVFSATLCNGEFMSNFLCSSYTMEQCTEAFTQDLAVLELESGIPAQVFETAVEDDYATAITLIQSIYSTGQSTSTTNELTNSFQELCTEYLDGNNIAYNKDDIQATAEKATELYMSNFQISQGDEISLYASDLKTKTSGIVALGLLLIALPIFTAFVLFEKKEKLIAQILSYVTTMGVTNILLSIVAFVASFFIKSSITPAIFGEALLTTIRTDIAIIAVIGIALTAIGIIVAIRTNSKTIEKRLATGIE
jgi:hypothetical protein